MKNNSSVTPLTDNGIKMARYSREKGFLDNEKARISEASLEEKTEAFLKVSSRIRREQKRINKECLKWLYERVRGDYYILAEIDRELKKGDLILSEIVETFKKEVSLEQFWAVTRSKPLILGRFPNNDIETLKETIKGHMEYLEQPQLKELTEEND